MKLKNYNAKATKKRFFSNANLLPIIPILKYQNV